MGAGYRYDEGFTEMFIGFWGLLYELVSEISFLQYDFSFNIRWLDECGIRFDEVDINFEDFGSNCDIFL